MLVSPMPSDKLATDTVLIQFGGENYKVTSIRIDKWQRAAAVIRETTDNSDRLSAYYRYYSDESYDCIDIASIACDVLSRVVDGERLSHPEYLASTYIQVDNSWHSLYHISVE